MALASEGARPLFQAARLTRHLAAFRARSSRPSPRLPATGRAAPPTGQFPRVPPVPTSAVG
eukprot:4001729-Lingulodinium_polyedra.AAC.1